MKYVVLTAVVFQLINIAMSQRSSYILTMVKTIRPGHETDIFVYILRGRRANIDINLRDSKWNVVSSVTGTVRAGVATKLTLKIPSLLIASEEYTIEASGSGSVSFNKNATVYVSSKSSSIFIQTDKRIYKPGQKVLFRCFGIYPNLTMVANEPYKIVIYNPEGTIIKQWLNATAEPSCVFEGQLQLTKRTNIGEWRIECSQLSAKEIKRFDVDEIVFPRFEVTMSVPSVTLVTDKLLIIPVSARYTFGKPVKGQLVMSYKSGRKQITKSYEFDGDLITEISISQIMTDLGRYITVEATVTEALTGFKQSTGSFVIIHRYPERLQFPPSLPTVFKPGFLYSGIVRLAQPDGNPVPGAEGKYANISIYYDMPINASATFRYLRYRRKNKGVSIFPGQPIRWLINKIARIPKNGIIKFGFLLPPAALSANVQICYKKACAYRYLQRAYSPSDSYIQLKLLSSASQIKVGGRINFAIKRNKQVSVVTYQIISQRLGTIVRYGRRVISQSRRRHLSLIVTHSMTPRCTIVVYYEEGNEVVADSLTLNINGLMDKHPVGIGFSKSEVQPAGEVTLSTKSASCAAVYILAVDKRTLLLKTGNDITQNDVVLELLRYGSGPIITPVTWSWIWPIYISGRDAYSIFEGAGAVVITDLLIYKHEFPTFSDGFGITSGIRRNFQESVTSDAAGEGGEIRVRRNLPETWLFKTLKAGEELKLEAPDAITTYVASAFAVCCENSTGLGVAALTANLTVFQKIFVRMTLPYAAIRGEILVVQVDLFNYENTDATFYVMIKLSTENFALISRLGEEFNLLTHPIFHRFWVKEIFVSANSVGTVYFPIKPKKIGTIPLRVDASIVHGTDHTPVDALERSLLVKAEGIPFSYSLVVMKYLRNNETQSSGFDFSFPLNVVDGSQHIQVSVVGDIMGTALNGIEDLLRMSYGCGEQNLIQFVPNVFITKYLNSTGRLTTEIKFKAKFFIEAGQIENDSILLLKRLSRTLPPGEPPLFLYATNLDVDILNAKYLMDREGENVVYRCLDEGDSIGLKAKKELHLKKGCPVLLLVNMPDDFVSGLTGKVTYKAGTRSISPVLRGLKLSPGYQRQLLYKRRDGSFSAFGNSDESGSTWLTAFVVKSFAQANDLVYIDPKIMENAINWLIRNQNPDGSFGEPGTVSNQFMQGGSTSSTRARAAFVVIALIESSNAEILSVNMTKRLRDVIDLTLDLISNNVPGSLQNAYEMAIVLYALSLADHPDRDSVFTALDALAIEEDGKKYWKLKLEDIIEESSFIGTWRPPKKLVRALDVELTSYVLASLAIMEDIPNALKVLHWVVTQQNPWGGFKSTQDTMVALQALTAIATLLFSGPPRMTVTISDPGGLFNHVFTVNSSNAVVTQIAEVNANVESLIAEVTGTGICIIEVSVFFNVMKELRVPSYWLNATITQESLHGYRLTLCFRWLKLGSSSMALVQIEVPTGMDFDYDTLETGKAPTYKRQERKREHLVLYFDSISTEVMCVSIYVSRVGYVVNPKPRPCSVIDYYEPSNRMTIEYLPDIIASSTLSDFCGRDC